MSENQNSGAPAETQPSDVSRETPTPPQRNKPSSFYVYLIVLFGAAFVLLLLAYFIQQRNNDAVQDDLRSITASREELLEDIQRLEEENLALRQDKEALGAQLAELQRQKDELEDQSFWREKDLQSQLASWHDLWGLEQNFRDKDYEACAQVFRNVSTSNYYATPPEAADRVEEIYSALVENGVLNEEDFSLPTILGAGENSIP